MTANKDNNISNKIWPTKVLDGIDLNQISKCTYILDIHFAPKLTHNFQNGVNFFVVV
jgi:hypothetical protein